MTDVDVRMRMEIVKQFPDGDPYGDHTPLSSGWGWKWWMLDDGWTNYHYPHGDEIIKNNNKSQTIVVWMRMDDDYDETIINIIIIIILMKMMNTTCKIVPMHCMMDHHWWSKYCISIYCILIDNLWHISIARVHNKYLYIDPGIIFVFQPWHNICIYRPWSHCIQIVHLRCSPQDIE